MQERPWRIIIGGDLGGEYFATREEADIGLAKRRKNWPTAQLCQIVYAETLDLVAAQSNSERSIVVNVYVDGAKVGN